MPRLLSQLLAIVVTSTSGAVKEQLQRLNAGLLVGVVGTVNNWLTGTPAAQGDASWTTSSVFRRFGRRTRRGLVIAFPIRRSLLALSYTEFAETRDIFDGVEAASEAIALSWGNRSSPLDPAKPVSRKTKLTGCFGNAVSTGS
jgi:hypothetical protein